MTKEEKAREARLRYLADRQGYTLQRSRARLRTLPTHGTYQILGKKGEVVAGDRAIGYGLNLDDVEAVLTGASR